MTTRAERKQRLADHLVLLAPGASRARVSVVGTATDAQDTIQQASVERSPGALKQARYQRRQSVINTEKAIERRAGQAEQRREQSSIPLEDMPEHLLTIAEKAKLAGQANVKLRKRYGGPPRIFENPEEMWKQASDYFDWISENPLYEVKVTHFQGDPVEMTSPKMRAMTIESLVLFIGVSRSAWGDYRKREEFVETVERIENIIYIQKLEGSAASLLNPLIIMRELGLKEHTDITSGGESISTITRTIIDDAKGKSE
jgi:hypothetical protein